MSDLLINYGLPEILSKIFKGKGNSIFIIILSMLTGFPSSSKYITTLLNQKLISEDEANRIIKFTHFGNPLFIINTIGINILNNKTMGFYILISHFLSNFVIAFILKKKECFENDYKINVLTFGKLLPRSIRNAFDSSLIILGNLITFKLLSRIIFKYVNFNNLVKAIVSFTLEITDGLFSLKDINLSLNIKALIITSFLSFGGFCIHSQVYSFLNETNVKYKNYLIGRIMQAIIAPIILLIIILICH